MAQIRFCSNARTDQVAKDAVSHDTDGTTLFQKSEQNALFARKDARDSNKRSCKLADNDFKWRISETFHGKFP